MIIARQLNARVLEGEQDTVGGSRKIPWRFNDVLPQTKLVVASGDFASDSIVLNAADSFALPLPKNYTNASFLQVFLKTTGLVKVVLVSPDGGTSTFLLKGTNDATNGVHMGLLALTDTVTSITITVPAGADDLQIDYMLYKLPDLTLAASYQAGSRTTGVVE